METKQIDLAFFAVCIAWLFCMGLFCVLATTPIHASDAPAERAHLKALAHDLGDFDSKMMDLNTGGKK